MSAADDVLEMQGLTTELADRLAGKVKANARIGAVADALGVGANRALEFIKGKARRVDAWEKENAKRRLHELKELERIERENEHLAWLECEVARHRAAGSEFRGPHVDGLEHFLRLARDASSAVALPDEEHDQSRERGGSEAAE